MAALAGKDGLVKISTNTVALMDSWEVNPDADILDITSFGDQWKVKLAGLKNWTAKISGKVDFTDTNGQLALWTAFLNGTSVTPRFHLDGTHYLSGTAFVKAFGPKVGVADSEQVEITLEGSGSLAYT
jgi:predicted secreted protein